MRSGWEAWTDDRDRTQHMHIRLASDDARRMDREALEMLHDAAWLIEQAFKGNISGPLVLPKTGLPIRDERP